MIDVQPAPPASVQPSVYDATPSVLPTANTLTHASGTVLHVEADRTYLTVGRSLIGTCTREEWDNPAHRRLAIARAWEQAVQAIRSEDETFVAFRPVSLYRDRATDRVLFADMSLPGQPGKWITPEGQRLLAPDRLALARCRAERTSYARWAEGPLPHISTEMAPGHTPDDDRDIQYLRHQNRDLRDLIDAALSPSEWADQANTKTDDGLVDFRIRGVFRRPDYRQLISKQTGEASGLLVGNGRVEVLPEVTEAPTTEAALDALLDADL